MEPSVENSILSPSPAVVTKDGSSAFAAPIAAKNDGLDDVLGEGYWDGDDYYPSDREIAEALPARDFFSPEEMQGLIDAGHRLDEKIACGEIKLLRKKEAISIRLDPDVLDHFRVMGKGWQTKLNQTLRDVIGLD